MNPIKCFNYYPTLDAFLCTPELKAEVKALGLWEWSPVVWMGRLFAGDQDFGEHWFDNCDDLETLQESGIPFEFPDGERWETLRIVRPSAFTERDPRCDTCKKDFKRLPCPDCQNAIFVGADGPCYSDPAKKAFWTDVLKSLTISRETLARIALDQHDHDNLLDEDLTPFIARANTILEGRLDAS